MKFDYKFYNCYGIVKFKIYVKYNEVLSATTTQVHFLKIFGRHFKLNQIFKNVNFKIQTFEIIALYFASVLPSS